MITTYLLAALALLAALLCLLQWAADAGLPPEAPAGARHRAQD